MATFQKGGENAIFGAFSAQKDFDGKWWNFRLRGGLLDSGFI